MDSLLSPPWPPKTRLGRVGRPSGLGPPDIGVGMGEGEWAGEAMRGFWAWGLRAPESAGKAWAGAGEAAREPNLMPEGGPAVGGVCLIWTDDLRLWWALLPLGPPLTMAGMVGTAGLKLAPFTGEAEADLPWCAV